MNTLAGLADSLLLADLLRALPQQPVPGVSRTPPVALAGSDPRALPLPAQGTPSLPAATTAQPATATPETTLSSAARVLGSVLAHLPGPPGPVMGATPLMADSPAHAPLAMAGRLSEAVSTSGLFYESHLAGLADGSIAASALEREPQARWGTERSRQQAPEGTPASAHGPAAATQAADARGAHETAAIPTQARTLVAQQLELLAAGVFRWQGEAWPGVPMEWSVREDRDAESHQADAAPRWSATLSLVLPELGRVDMRLALADRHLGATVSAGAAATARLRDAAGELETRLAAAGFESPDLAVTASVQP